MSYLVTGRSAIDRIALEPQQIVAQGEAMVFEGPWPWPSPVVARIDDAAVETLRTRQIGG